MLPSLEDALRWRHNPCQCIKEVFRDPDTGGEVVPAPWHEEAFSLVRDHDRISIRAARGVGKTTWLAWCAYWRNLCFFPARNIFTSPRKEQLSAAAWNEMGKWHRAMRPDIQDMFRVLSDKVVMNGVPSNLSIATTVGAGSSDYAGLLGIHDAALMWVVDEANGVRDSVFNSALGSLTTRGGKVLLTGNPVASSGFFFRTHTNRKMKDRWRTLHVSAFDVKHMSYFDPGWIEEMRDTWDERSPEWSAYVLGEFPEENAGAVIPAALIIDAAQRKVTQKNGYFPVWGYDPAYGGGDRCALVKRRGNIVTDIQSWRFASTDTILSRDKIVDQYYACDEDDRPATIVVDTTVGGVEVANDLRRLGLPITGIGASEKPIRAELYVNWRAEMWHRGRAWFETRECSIPDNDEFVEELAAAGRKMTSTNNQSSTAKMLVESKDDIRDRIGRSTDLADAFLLTLCVPSKERDPTYLRKEIAARRGVDLAAGRYPTGTTWQSQLLM